MPKRAKRDRFRSPPQPSPAHNVYPPANRAGRLQRVMNAACQNTGGVLLWLTLLISAGYANVVRGPFFFDDEHFIIKNRAVHDLDLQRIYTSSVTEGASIAGNMYRPNQQMVFALLYKLFGPRSSVAYHVASILLHLLNSFLVFFLLTRLSFGRVASFLAAALFLIHPAQTEAISYISGFADPLSLFLMLATLIHVISILQSSASPSWWSVALCSVGALLALLTKENAVVLLPLGVVICAYGWSRWGSVTLRRSVAPLLAIGVPVLVYVCLRFTVLRFSQSIGLTEERNIYTDNLSIRLITFVNVLIDYAKIIVFPRDLYYAKPYTAYTELSSPRALFGIVWLAVFAFSAAQFKARRNLFLGLGWFFAALFPFAGFVPLNAMYLEHWLYVPIIGICILVASAYERLADAKSGEWMLASCMVVLLLCAVRTVARNRQWADVEQFYLNELKYSDESVSILNNLGMFYADRGQYGKAIEFYARSITTLDAFAQPHHNLAEIYFRLGRDPEAVDQLYRALRIDPGFGYSLTRLRDFYRERGDEERAARADRLLEHLHRGETPRPEDIENIRRVPAGREP